MKEEYLNKINEYYNKICAVTSSDNPSTIEYSVKKILELIAKLINEDDGYNYEELYRCLNHTLGKEVVYALSAYNKTLGKNAPKVRKTEYNQQLQTAITQIRVDIGSLLK